MQLSQALQDDAIRKEMIAMSLLSVVIVVGISVWMAIPWWIALPVLMVYLVAYPVLAAILTRARIQLARRVLLMTWGIYIWLGLCVVAVLVRGTTAYTPEVATRTVGTAICTMGGLWVVAGWIGRQQIVFATTMMAFWSVFVTWLGLALFLGRGWCGWFCYLGVAPGLASFVGSLGGLGRWRQRFARRWLDPIRKNELSPRFGYLRHAVLLSAVLLTGWLATPVFCYICPIRVLFDQWEIRYDTLTLTTVSTGVFLFLSSMVVGPLLTGKRIWCAYLCPLGSATSFIAWLRVRLKLPATSARIDAARCQECLSCVRACEFNLISPQAISQNVSEGRDVTVGSECTACADCLAACPQEAIELVSGWSSRTCSAPPGRETSFATPGEDSRGVELTGYGPGQVRTLPYIRQVAFVLLLAFFVFYTVFLLKTYVPLFGAR
jgi:ferredoxin-type protein NapH